MIRKVITDSSRYKYYTITENETQFVVRVLCPTLYLNTDVTIYKLDDILSTKSMLGKTIGVNDGYDVIAEGIFDKETMGHLWKAGSTITFYVTPQSIARGVVEVVNIDGFLGLTGETETEYHARLGNTVIAKLYCSDSKATIPEMDKQILVDTMGALFTNIDTSNSTDTNEYDVNFGLNIGLYLPKEIKANSECEIKVGSKINDHPLNGCLYVNTSARYIPNRMVKLTNGVGSFKLNTNGLTIGEVVELCVGSKVNPNKFVVLTKLQ